MKICSKLVRATLALTIAAFSITASAADRPVKPKRDFRPEAASPDVFTFTRPGIVVKIVSAAIATDGTITTRFTIADPKGAALDMAGVATPGPVTVRFIAATILAGQRQYTAYTVAAAKATLNSNPTQIQASTDSGGTTVKNADGDYTYTFKTKAPAGFDATATHTIGVTAQRDLSEFMTYDEWSETSNDTFEFVPNGSAVKVIRDVVPTSACNQCHDPLFGHGGSRLTVAVCILCHQPQTINPDTMLTQDMPVLIHKLHMGANLPSVKAGTPYRIYHRGAWSDFSTVVFPQDMRNCTTCHTKPARQADNWKLQASRAVCGSCHDDVNFATGLNHVNFPVFDDNSCTRCHNDVATSDFDASIPGAHVIPNNSASLPGLVAQVLKVDGTAPGSAPVVTFKVTDKTGAPVDISKLTQIRVVLAGPNVDYQTGPGALRLSEDPSKTVGSNGVYTYTMTGALPAGAAGSYTVFIQARNTVNLLPGTVQQVAATDAALPALFNFSVDKSPVVARRQVVSDAKCFACHNDLKFIHSAARAAAMACPLCHNPSLSDGTSKQSVDFPVQIHSIHRGDNLVNPYILGTTNYQEVRFPGDLRVCTTCHVGTTYRVETVGAKAMVSSPGGFTATTPPISAACQGCHDDIGTASHALANTTVLGESCAACHSQTSEFSVEKVHARN